MNLTPHPKCIRSGSLQCECYYTFFSLTRLAPKCVMCSDDRWWDQNPHLLILSPETLCAQNCLWHELLLCLAEKRCSFCHIWQVFKKWCHMVVWMHGLRNKLCPVIIVVLINHHTPSLTFCNGILWINMVLSADQSLLFWEVTYSVRWNKASFLNRITVGSVSTA